MVAQPSTPASYFHLLRQHSLGEKHRPLVVFTEVDAQAQGGRLAARRLHRGLFRPVIGDADADVDAVDTLLLCSGRVTWDLKVERAKREDGQRVAIARIEQLYPRPVDRIREEIKRYPNLKAIRWVQDERFNMGPWPHYQLNTWPELGDEVGIRIEPVTREASASRRSAWPSGTRRSRRTCSPGPSPPWTRGPRRTEQY